MFFFVKFWDLNKPFVQLMSFAYEFTCLFVASTYGALVFSPTSSNGKLEIEYSLYPRKKYNEESNNFNFDQIYKRKLLTFISPNRFSMKIYYI